MSKRILIVDDSKFMRSRLKKCLVAAGYEVDEAENGLVGLETAKMVTPDLVVSDVNMPVMEGPELVKGLSEYNPNIPIVILTANPDRDLKFDVMDYNVRAFLSKLHKIEKIAERIKSILD